MAIQNSVGMYTRLKSLVHDVAESKDSNNQRKYLVLNDNRIGISLNHESSSKAIQEIVNKVLTTKTNVQNVNEAKEILQDLKRIAESEENELSIGKFFTNLFGGDKSNPIQFLNKQEAEVDVNILNNLLMMQIFGFGNSHKSSQNVSQAEIKAFNLYTSNAYTFINPFLRKQKAAFSSNCECMKGMIEKFSKGRVTSQSEAEKEISNECLYVTDLINSGLAKLPKYNGKAYRGDMMTDEEFQTLMKGTYEDLAYMSFSTSEKIGMLFSAREPKAQGEKHRVMFRVMSRNARPVKEFAENKSEDEVLYLPGQKFKVVNKQTEVLENPSNHRKYEVLVVDLEEV